MIYLKPITYDNINDFTGTSYDKMSFEDKHNLIEESINKIHNGQYFEFLVVYDNDTIVGFMNLYAHSKHIIKIKVLGFWQKQKHWNMPKKRVILLRLVEWMKTILQVLFYTKN